ncbi:phosphatidylethanolamine-binding protein [candidate division LCP-89 bacterium B3_LCP]|uniref:Phosphatidylethanolamine-binding protein n=1 Tax=candidate division LCP-89 bacterium B3_LCP TaxID=2012998 RepID=A0A532V634_UNCL8|nr:MAG: phosphatidylethanolamine-binding protein [candidate division LCP-89 bacterium B3_LCP]
MNLTLTSPAFEEGAMIPEKYTNDGANVSPPLAWVEVPEGTESFALICDDPDAPMGTWVHWVVYNLPGDTRELPENFPPGEEPVTGGKQGLTDFGSYGYGGPAPPSGTHRYFFKLFALDCQLDLTSSVRKSDLLKAMEGHVLAQGQLMGRYRRR